MRVRIKKAVYQGGVTVPAGSVGEVLYASQVNPNVRSILYVRLQGIKDQIIRWGTISPTYEEASITVSYGDPSLPGIHGVDELEAIPAPTGEGHS